MTGGWIRMAVVAAGAFACLASAGSTIDRPARSDIERLFNVASADMGCAKLKVKKAGKWKRRVSGCDMTRTYVLACRETTDYKYDTTKTPDPMPCDWRLHGGATVDKKPPTEIVEPAETPDVVEPAQEPEKDKETP